MQPPTEEEVRLYIKQKKGWPDEFVNHMAEKFWNFYESKGWLVGRVKMKSWQAAFNSQWQQLRKEDIEYLNKCQSKKPEIKEMKTDTEIEKLDQLLAQYKAKFESVPFSEFGKWYDFMGKNKLLTQLSPQDIEIIKKCYPDDNYKCRCAHVQQTFSGFAGNGMTFQEIINLRNRLA